ncbi:unnamed protein product [Parnassius mnemosyne]|uniref:Interleukin-7 n=1 Tax=Parnassius mnemosyne TaxID=213953 RepID=A0AAV1LVV2_9NEOP
MDCNTIGDTKLLPKLNDEHVMLGKVKKMKVKNCVRVLSHKVEQALNFAANFCKFNMCSQRPKDFKEKVMKEYCFV